jgi:alkylation response protein AidB-like acyl-CoA dehydrogenase
VNFDFDEDQSELRRTVRRFLERSSAETDVRRLMAAELGYDAAVWEQMATQLGLHGLAIPEEYGGAGFSFIELGVVLEEMGRALLCAPFFASVVLAAELLKAVGDEQARKDYLPGIASGETIATVALTEADGQWRSSSITMRAVLVTEESKEGMGRRAGGGGVWQLTGTKTFVPDGASAGLILVVARTGDGIGIFAVDAKAAGLSRQALPTMDQTRKQARLEFDAVQARLLGGAGDGWTAVSRMLLVAAVGLAAEQVGGAQRALEMAVDYAKLREQFGRPIGSFQAIKHKCASMLVAVESMKSAAYYGLWAVASGDDELPVVSSIAKVCCSDGYTLVTSENIQIHGGIGFTWEHPAHLYFKRARSSRVLLGGPDYHRDLIARLAGITPADDDRA